MIYDVDKVDIMAKRKDGGLDLFIISSGAIDASQGTQKLLLDKISNYFGYILSADFCVDFPDVKKGEVTIVLEFSEPAPKILLELCERIAIWIEDNGMLFVVKQKKI